MDLIFIILQYPSNNKFSYSSFYCTIQIWVCNFHFSTKNKCCTNSASAVQDKTCLQDTGHWKDSTFPQTGSIGNFPHSDCSDSLSPFLQDEVHSHDICWASSLSKFFWAWSSGNFKTVVMTFAMVLVSRPIIYTDRTFHKYSHSVGFPRSDTYVCYRLPPL